ncbi:hypothetical protein [Phaeobacter sp. HF9A]|uniref:hypothetical protein n=1 Tax=Phaeobacter sp. HF9A TaxID=2721561 RepID=UPI00143083C2|nr:hypothetical protein [Phaeobacter sp. HF9A]NIZ12703.1 hypothetical protein [Phaeobacter sp. HF9A]
MVEFLKNKLLSVLRKPINIPIGIAFLLMTVAADSIVSNLSSGESRTIGHLVDEAARAVGHFLDQPLVEVALILAAFFFIWLGHKVESLRAIDIQNKAMAPFLEEVDVIRNGFHNLFDHYSTIKRIEYLRGKASEFDNTVDRPIQYCKDDGRVRPIEPVRQKVQEILTDVAYFSRDIERDRKLLNRSGYDLHEPRHKDMPPSIVSDDDVLVFNELKGMRSAGQKIFQDMLREQEQRLKVVEKRVESLIAKSAWADPEKGAKHKKD